MTEGPARPFWGPGPVHPTRLCPVLAPGLLWQSTHSEFYFCDAYWPAFRKVDFLRALRSYAARNRRYGV